jgi:hypothetical protein
MEMDCGRDFSAQAREEWWGIKLANAGQNLTFLEWRKFPLEFEVPLIVWMPKMIVKNLICFMTSSRPFGKRRS